MPPPAPSSNNKARHKSGWRVDPKAPAKLSFSLEAGRHSKGRRVGRMHCSCFREKKLARSSRTFRMATARARLTTCSHGNGARERLTLSQVCTSMPGVIKDTVESVRGSGVSRAPPGAERSPADLAQVRRRLNAHGVTAIAGALGSSDRRCADARRISRWLPRSRRTASSSLKDHMPAVATCSGTPLPPGLARPAARCWGLGSHRTRALCSGEDPKPATL